MFEGASTPQSTGSGDRGTPGAEEADVEDATEPAGVQVRELRRRSRRSAEDGLVSFAASVLSSIF